MIEYSLDFVDQYKAIRKLRWLKQYYRVRQDNRAIVQINEQTENIKQEIIESIKVYACALINDKNVKFIL